MRNITAVKLSGCIKINKSNFRICDRRCSGVDSHTNLVWSSSRAVDTVHSVNFGCMVSNRRTWTIQLDHFYGNHCTKLISFSTYLMVFIMKSFQAGDFLSAYLIRLVMHQFGQWTIVYYSLAIVNTVFGILFVCELELLISISFP